MHEKKCYNSKGFDAKGYSRSGYNNNGFNRIGFDKRGYNKAGFDENGINKLGFDISGFDKAGFDKDGFNRNGWNKDSINKKTGTKFDSKGFDLNGFNNRGFDKHYFDKNGFDENGFNKYGFNNTGYNRQGYDKSGYNKAGWNIGGIHKDTGTKYTPGDIDINGMKLISGRVFLLVTQGQSEGETDFLNILERYEISVHETVRLNRAQYNDKALYIVLDGIEDSLMKGDIVAIVRGGGDTEHESFAPYKDKSACKLLTRFRKENEVVIVTGVGHSDNNFPVEDVADYPQETPTDAANQVGKLITGELKI